MKNKIKQLEKEIDETIAKSPVESDPRHSKSTQKWVIKLKPDADYALQIAARSHDIERSFNDIKVEKEDYQNRLTHSKRSATIILALLKKYNFSKDFSNKVNYLVLNHEWGGDCDATILANADCISFFEGNLENYFKKFGEERTKYKITNRLKTMSKEAKKRIKKFKYKNPKLNTIFKNLLYY